MHTRFRWRVLPPRARSQPVHRAGTDRPGDRDGHHHRLERRRYSRADRHGHQPGDQRALYRRDERLGHVHHQRPPDRGLHREGGT